MKQILIRLDDETFIGFLNVKIDMATSDLFLMQLRCAFAVALNVHHSRIVFEM